MPRYIHNKFKILIIFIVFILAMTHSLGNVAAEEKQGTHPLKPYSISINSSSAANQGVMEASNVGGITGGSEANPLVAPKNATKPNATAPAYAITWDFETGDLRGWTKTGDAFDNEPTTSGININNQGKYWISSEDDSKGTLTSKPFKINGDKISFLIGGNKSNLFDESIADLGCYAALIMGQDIIESASSYKRDGMYRSGWNVSKYKGKVAEIQLVDDSSTGHISFDDVEFDVPPTIANLFTVHDGESIQAAIDKANPGDMIEVYSGTYRENLNVNKKLNLYGVDTGDGDPVIDAQNLGSAIIISADGVDLGWFNVTNSLGRHDAGIKVYSSWNNIHDIFASNNYIGMFLSKNSNNSIDFIRISGNNGSSTYGGLVLDNSSNNIVKSIDVSTNDIGIFMNNSRDNKIWPGISPITDYLKKNKITGNRIGIQLSNSYDNSLEWNNLSGNGASAFDDGNNEWSCNTYGEIRISSSVEKSTYSIPGGSNVDEYANAHLHPPLGEKTGKPTRRVHEKEDKKNGKSNPKYADA